MFDNFLRNLVTKEWKMGRFRIAFLDLLLLVGMTLMGIAIRFSLKDVESMDYQVCLKPWVDEFKAVGSFKAICGDFYNYTPPYMYILYLISLLPIEPLYPIKMVSSVFDLILAILSAGIVMDLTQSRTRSFLAYGVVFCLPTVAVNSGLWGQCDVIYVTFIIASLFFLYREHSHISMLCYGMAFALKLQSLFVFPLYVFLWVRKKYKIEQFLYLPFVYLLMCIPSALAGKSIKELLLVYVAQGNTEPWMLSWNWPNIYLLFGPNNFYEQYSTVGTIGTVGMLMLLLYFCVKRFQECDKDLILRGMLLFALVVPFFLPYMHERYGYLADILAVILSFVHPAKFYIAVTEILLSYTAYTGYLHGASTVPQPFYCFVMALLVAIVSLQMFVPDFEKRLYSKSSRFLSATSDKSDNQA
jgi:Gpi18-like mannosyltransferase